MICYNSHLRSVLLMPVSKLQQHSCINIAHGSWDILIPALRGATEWTAYENTGCRCCRFAVGVHFSNETWHIQALLSSRSDKSFRHVTYWRHCILHFLIDDHAGFMLYIYIYAFSRRFYPKWLTVHSGYTYFCQYMFRGKRTHNLCAANAML